jgi:hypothetical protein
VVIFGLYPHSSSSSRFTAGASEFFILSQSGERPADDVEVVVRRLLRAKHNSFYDPIPLRPRGIV